MHRVAIALVAILAAGCGKDEKQAAPDEAAKPSTGAAGKTVDPTPAPTPTPTPAPDRFAAGYCAVQIRGATTRDAKGPGGAMAVGTDYWTSLETSRKQLEMTVKDPAKVEEGLKQDPRMFTLLVNCVDPQAQLNLNFMPASGSKYADVPFGPKTYKLRPSMEAKPGDMTLMFGLDQAGFYQLDGEGTFDVTKFDTTSLAGTFAFKVKDGDKQLDVTGEFELRCDGSAWDLCGK